MEWRYIFLLLMRLSELFVSTVGLCEPRASTECLDTASDENACNFVYNHTTFDYILTDEKTADYTVQFVSLKNACGFHKYVINVELLQYAKSYEQCAFKSDISLDDVKNVHDIVLPLEDNQSNCSKLKLEFCMKYWFSGCYSFTINPYTDTNSHRPVTYYIWMKNNYTLDDFSIKSPVFKTIALNPIEVSWNFKPRTFVDEDISYRVELKHNNENYTVVTNSCSLFEQTVTCQFHNLTDGKYMLYFNLYDLWRCFSADLFGACSWPTTLPKYKISTVSSEYKFEIPVGHQLKYLDWILVGALILVFVLIIVVVLWYKRYRPMANPNMPIEIYSKHESTKHIRGILLLYARDCNPFMETMAELRKYLASRTKSKVYDIFDSNLFDDIATSPHEFIESILQDPHVNVIVISTECFEQLYQSMLQYFSNQSNLDKEVSHLSQLYRMPHWLDSLVLHTLKLISYDTSAASYKKFFVVRLPKFNGLGNYLIHINPCTRFDLPGGLDTLIERVSSPLHENGLMNSIENRESLHRTLYNLNTFILNKPHYLYTDILKSKVDNKNES